MPIEKLRAIASHPHIHPEAEINAEGGGILDLDPDVRIRKGAALDCSRGGHIKIGANTTIFPGALILAYGGSIAIDDHCTVNPYCILYGHGGLRIGDYVRIAAHTVIIPANHNFDDPDTPITKQGLTKRGIAIEDDVWIGVRVTILDGVTIGRGAVIGAAAVVTKDVPAMAKMVGHPAKQIGVRGGNPRVIGPGEL
jgi:acetyltransferase-like isoleucine patch superfamily enzyme